MDLLFKRYASPFLFIDSVLQVNKFDEFVYEFINIIGEENELKQKEKEEHYNWEFFLHRIFDKSYKEFIDEIKVEQDNRNMTVTEIETTIKETENILANFNPEERG